MASSQPAADKARGSEGIQMSQYALPQQQGGDMGYIDRTLSYSEGFGGELMIHNRPPIKEIALAMALLTFGALGICGGFLMTYYKVGGDRTHGIAFFILGALLFLPGFYETRIAYYAYKGYKGFSFADIPAV